MQREAGLLVQIILNYTTSVEGAIDSTSVIISQSTYAPAAEEKFINSGLPKMDEL